MIIRFTPKADAELTGAREWYSHQRKNLDLVIAVFHSRRDPAIWKSRVT